MLPFRSTTSASNPSPPDFLAWLQTCSVRSDDPLSPQILPLKPWKGQLRLAAELATGDSLIVLKERQMGATTGCTAPYARYCAEVKGWRVGYVSKGQDEAREFLTHVQELRPGGRFIADYAYFESGGVIRVFPSTPSAGVGSTFQLFIFDEYAEHPWARENHYKAGPAFARGQCVIQSTADPKMGAAGDYFDKWGKAQLGAFYRPVFIGRYSRPEHDDPFYEAQEVELGERIARAYYPAVPEEAFQSQEGLVYRDFELARHVCPPEMRFADCQWRIVGFDPGGGDPNGIVVIGSYARAEGLRASGTLGIRGLGRLHVYSARRHASLPLTELAKWWKGHPEFGSYLYPRGSALYVGETGGDTQVQTLQAMNIPAYKPTMAKWEGIEHVRELLRTGRLTISPECTELIAEFSQYWVKARKDIEGGVSQPDTQAGGGHHADLLDALRYACMGVRDSLPTTPQRLERVGSVAMERAGYRNGRVA